MNENQIFCLALAACGVLAYFAFALIKSARIRNSGARWQMMQEIKDKYPLKK